MDGIKKVLNTKVGKQLDPFEHARKRPGMYVGSVITEEKLQRVVVTKNDSDFFEEKKISFNPGLERLFIEILSNAKDNFWESEKAGAKMTFIRISFQEGMISVENDGLPIPVIKNKYVFKDHTGQRVEQLAYPAEKFFGNMAFSTNFEKDEEKKKSSGLNGVGGKLANIFSEKFEVFIKDHYNQKTFQQVYTSAGKKKKEPVVKNYKGKTSSTCVSFLPDFEYFSFAKHPHLSMVLKRHAYETAFIFPGLRVYFNDQLIKFTQFSKIVDFYSPETIRMIFKSPSGDECVLVPNSEFIPTDKVLSVSFINGIRCERGGVHVESWASMILTKLRNLLNLKRAKKISQNKFLYPFFTFYIRSETDEDISFDSQTKEFCVSPSPFPSFPKTKKQRDEYFTLVDSQIQKVAKWPVIDLIIARLNGKIIEKVKNTKLLIYDKNFVHANNAGPNYKGVQPRIGFIVEGLSAKKLWEMIRIETPGGNNFYGGHPIKGKFTNSEKASGGKMLAGEDLSNNETLVNDEVHQSLRSFFGLRLGVDYSKQANRDTLNYDLAYAMTDSDDDGVHIRGLLLLFFSLFPGLLESGFFGSFNTYNVILTPKKKGEKPEYFFSHIEFQKWLSEKERDLTKYNPRYFKGLGSYGPLDARLHSTPETQFVSFFKKDENAIENLKIVFSQKTDQRKKWMEENIKKARDLKKLEICPVSGSLTITDFVNKELVHFFIMTLSRALPSLLDSMKQCQRQIVDTALNTPNFFASNVNLIEFEGQVKKHTSYEHASVYTQVCNMVVGYPGSNNLPLFLNAGQYANRMENINSAQRYLFTKNTPEIRSIFVPEDTPLLSRRVSSGAECEYEFMLPIVPLCLINGVLGVACGWKSQIYPHNPKDIIQGLRECIDGTFDVTEEDYLPWFRGFKGKVYRENGGVYTEGILKIKDGKYHIEELPIGLFGADCCKKYLNPLLQSSFEKLKTAPKKSAKTTKKNTKIEEEKVPKNDQKFVGNFDATENVNHPKFILTPSKSYEYDEKDFSFLKKRLINPLHVVVDQDGVPKTFKSARALLKKFYQARIVYYQKRREYWIPYYENEIKKLDTKIRFVKDVSLKKIDITKSSKEVISYMEENEYHKDRDGTFDYLLRMQVWSFNLDKVKELRDERQKIVEKKKYYKDNSPEDIYREDLDRFEKAWDGFLQNTVKIRRE